MTLEQRAKKAVELKNFGGCNCCQAVLSVLADQTELTREQLCKTGSGFAVGMGNMEATCGSLIGAIMVAGLKAEGKGSVRYAKQISEDFKAKSGAVTCKELKGRDTGRVLCPCDRCVYNAVMAYGEIMGLE